MAELPEVETLRRQLLAAVAGLRWDRVEAVPSSIFRSPAKAVVAALTGARLARVDRRGKVLLLGFGVDRVLLVHLGMSGQILLVPPAEPGLRHRHLVATLEDGRTLVFRDPRRFGFLKLARAAELGGLRELASVGLDPLDPGQTWEKFVRDCAGRAGAVKPLLMDQGCFAGIGNIYADEILFVSRVRPTRLTSSLNPVERKELFHAIRDILASAIEYGGTSFDAAFTDIFGRPGLYGGRLRVYGREGEPCDRCSTTLKLARVGGRSSVFCPHCQK